MSKAAPYPIDDTVGIERALRKVITCQHLYWPLGCNQSTSSLTRHRRIVRELHPSRNGIPLQTFLSGRGIVAWATTPCQALSTFICRGQFWRCFSGGAVEAVLDVDASPCRGWWFWRATGCFDALQGYVDAPAMYAEDIDGLQSYFSPSVGVGVYN